MSAVAPVPNADTLVRTLSDSGGIGVRVVSGRELVAESARRHATAPLATVALGRALMGALLLGAGGKDDETVQLRFRGDGALGHVVAIADCDGRVRGYVSRPDARAPSADRPLDVAGGLGLGDLSVVRHRPGWRKPYTGIVPLTSGQIAEDLALYLTESEQTPSAVGLGVRLDADADGGIEIAAGFLTQVLPGARDDEVAQLEANVRTLASPTEWFAAGGDAGGLAEALLDGLGGRTLGVGPARFHCGCTRERVVRAVALLGRDDLDEAVRVGEVLEVRCEFCAERYEVAAEQARALLPDA